MLWLLLRTLDILFGKPCGSDSGTCDPQTPAGHGHVRPHTVTSVRGSDDMDIVLITDDTARADLIEALGYLNATAKDMRRKGYVGIASESYARQHARIDAVLYELVP